MESTEGITLRLAIYHQHNPVISHPEFTGWQARWYSISNQHLTLLSSWLLLTNHASTWQHIKMIEPHNFNCIPGTLKWSFLLLHWQYVFRSREMDQTLIISELWVQLHEDTTNVVLKAFQVNYNYWRSWEELTGILSIAHQGISAYLYGSAAVKTERFGLSIFKVHLQNIWHEKKWIVLNCFLPNKSVNQITTRNKGNLNVVL